MSKLINDLLQAINESAPVVATLTRKASDNAELGDQGQSLSINTLQQDLLTKDPNAVVTDNGDGTLTLSSFLGDSVEYIANKHGYLVVQEPVDQE